MIGEAAGVRAQQVSDWETERTPPGRRPLERLAKALKLDMSVFEEGGAMPSVAPSSNGSQELAEIAADRDYQGESAGWLWGDPTEGEEFMRTVLRNLERTTRAMVGKSDLFSAEDLRLNRLGVVRAAMHSHELAGRPVPHWLRVLHDQVSDGSFR